MAEKAEFDPAQEFRRIYHQAFAPAELQDLETMLQVGLANEVAMLRLYGRRVLELARGIDDVDKAVYVFNSLGQASSRIATLLKAQAALSGDGDEGMRAVISQALADVVAELGIKERYQGGRR